MARVWASNTKKELGTDRLTQTEGWFLANPLMDMWGVHMCMQLHMCVQVHVCVHLWMAEDTWDVVL